MDCSLPGSSVHEIFPARTLERAAIFFSRGSSQPRDPTHISCTRRQLLYHWATREAQRRQSNGISCCLDVYCMRTVQFVGSLYFWWVFRLFPMLYYYKQCCKCTRASVSQGKVVFLICSLLLRKKQQSNFGV